MRPLALLQVYCGWGVCLGNTSLCMGLLAAKGVVLAVMGSLSVVVIPMASL